MIGLLVALGFSCQALGFVFVVAAALRWNGREHEPEHDRLGYLVWGGVLIVSAGTTLLLISLALAASSAAL